jgi:hypothetical protein
MPMFTSKFLSVQSSIFCCDRGGYLRISISIVVSFVARALSPIPGNLFCYSAISSAGVVVDLARLYGPCVSSYCLRILFLFYQNLLAVINALELTSRNILCGSVRIVCTLFLVSGHYLQADPNTGRSQDSA